MSVGAGTTDLTELFVKLNMPIIGVLALLLATWTTNTTNFYQSGLAFTRFCGAKDGKRPLLTAIIGVIATVLAVLGALDFFVPMLNAFSVMIPPIAGIMMADYWIIGKGKKENWGIIPGFNFAGIGAWIAGMAVGFFVNVFSPAFNSIVVGMIVYLILNAALKNVIPAARNPEEFIGE
ncbi:cytosine permease [Anaerovoracaceae bacterium 41-7]